MHLAWVWVVSGFLHRPEIARPPFRDRAPSTDSADGARHHRVVTVDTPQGALDRKAALESTPGRNPTPGDEALVPEGQRAVDRHGEASAVDGPSTAGDSGAGDLASRPKPKDPEDEPTPKSSQVAPRAHEFGVEPRPERSAAVSVAGAVSFIESKRNGPRHDTVRDTVNLSEVLQSVFGQDWPEDAPPNLSHDRAFFGEEALLEAGEKQRAGAGAHTAASAEEHATAGHKELFDGLLHMCMGCGAVGAVLAFCFKKLCEPTTGLCKVVWRLPCCPKSSRGAKGKEKEAKKVGKPMQLVVSVLELLDPPQNGKYLVSVAACEQPGTRHPKWGEQTSEGNPWLESLRCNAAPGSTLTLGVYKCKGGGKREYVACAEVDVDDEILGPMQKPGWDMTRTSTHFVRNTNKEKCGKLVLGFYRPQPETRLLHLFGPGLEDPMARALHHALMRLEEENHKGMDSNKRPKPINRVYVLARMMSLSLNLGTGIGEKIDLRQFQVLRKAKSKKWFWVYYDTVDSSKVEASIPIAAIYRVTPVSINKDAFMIGYRGRTIQGVQQAKSELYVGRNTADFIHGRDEIIQGLRLLLDAVADDERDAARGTQDGTDEERGSGTGSGTGYSGHGTPAHSDSRGPRGPRKAQTRKQAESSDADSQGS